MSTISNRGQAQVPDAPRATRRVPYVSLWWANRANWANPRQGTGAGLEVTLQVTIAMGG